MSEATKQQKAIEVLARVGRPKGFLRRLDDSEIDRLADIYDVEGVEFKPAFGKIWADHIERVENSKAVVDPPEPKKRKTKNQ